MHGQQNVKKCSHIVSVKTSKSPLPVQLVEAASKSYSTPQCPIGNFNASH